MRALLTTLTGITALVGAALTPAAAAAPAEQPVRAPNWSACFSAVADQANQQLAELGEPADVRYECAVVQVPLDYARPGGASLNLSLVRLPATGPGARTGSLFLNPGGPGGSGVDFAVFFAPFIDLELQAPIRRSFDVVGFDPRGVVRSTPLRCFGNERQAARVFDTAPFPTTEEEVQQRIAADALLTDGCERRGSKAGPHMSTANVARDLDRLRRAVGDDALSYFGGSYGSFLGVSYAALFPDRVRAVVVDGNLDPEAWVNLSARVPFSSALRSDLGARATLERFFELCDATPGDGRPGSCRLSGAGGTAGDRFAAIVDRLRAAPVEVVDPDTGDRVLWTYQDLIGTTLSILYNPFDYYVLGELLALVEAGAAPAELGAFLHRAERDTALVAKRGFPNYVNFAEGFAGVGCSDTTSPSGYDAWRDPAPLPEAPYDGYFGPIWTWASSPCATWPLSDDGRYTGPWDPETRNPLLVIGNRWDPATRYEGAQRVKSLLGSSASLVTVSDPGHTSLGISPFCAGPITGQYLLDPAGVAPAVDGTVCDPFPANWIDVGAPSGDGPPPGLRVGADLRHRLLHEVAYRPPR